MYKILGQQKPGSTTDTDLYVVPTGKSVVISSITMTNVTTSTDSVRIHVVESGGTIADNRALVKDFVMLGNNTISLTIGVTLGVGEKISVYSTNGRITFMCFGNEV